MRILKNTINQNLLGIPCRKDGLTAEKLAALYLRYVVGTFGIRHEIMSDCAHLINSRFMNTLCARSGVTQHTSIVYRPKGNGRAETAVRLLIDMFRRAFADMPTTRTQALPWALWQLNELPGVDGSHAPNTIVLGSEQKGLGDAPSFRMGRSSEGAEEWFQKVLALRRQVQHKVESLHAEHTKRHLATHKSVED